MPEYTYFGNRGTLTIGGETIAVLKGIEAKATYDVEELYGMDSIVRADVAKHTLSVEVTVSSAKFDPTLATGIGSIYGLTMLGAGTGAEVTTFTDTNAVATFSLEFTATGTGATYDTKVSVANVYFDALPFPRPENDFVVFELSGKGSNWTITQLTA